MFVTARHSPTFNINDLFTRFYAPQLYLQVLLRARTIYVNSVCPSVRLSVCHDPVRIHGQVR